MPSRAFAASLAVILREATRSPWICLSALQSRRETAAEPETSNGADPVLVLGGLFSHPYYYAPLGRILSRRGYAVHFDDVFNVRPFRSHVSSLRKRVEEIVAVRGAPVRIVGHSLGGIHAMALLAACPSAVAQVIAVASPVVGGTPWGPLQRLAERVLQVRATETALLRGSVTPYAARITTISSPGDLVAPPASCAVGGASNVVLSTVPRADETLASHGGVVFMRAAVKVILATLARPAAALPAPA
jgi:alpha-beta hydrolase superfamily lysophospholipase